MNCLKQMRLAIRSEAALLSHATSVLLIMILVDNVISLGILRLLFVFYILGLVSYGISEGGIGPPEGDQGAQVHLHRLSFLSIIIRMTLDAFLAYGIFLSLIYSIEYYKGEDVRTDYHLWVIPWTVKTPRVPGCKSVWTMILGMFLMICSSYRVVLLAAMFLYKGVMSLTNLMARDDGDNQVEAPAADDVEEEVQEEEVQEEEGNPTL